MGLATAAIVGGTLLGVGASALMSKKQAKKMASDNFQQYRPSMPDSPAMPTVKAGDDGATANAAMEAERERERNAARLRQLQAPEIATSGLGAHGEAGLAKKSLLGG